MTVEDLLNKLRALDKNTLSCLREDLETIERKEKLDAKSGLVVYPEVHARYMEGLNTLLDLVAALEGYNRNDVIQFDFSDLLGDNPNLTEIVESHTEEEVTTRWTTA